MKCSECGENTGVKDTRTLTTEDNVCFTRRIRYCCGKHKTITHEIYAGKSPIPDKYRMKRTNKTKSMVKKVMPKSTL
jgi:hypothetical protein